MRKPLLFFVFLSVAGFSSYEGIAQADNVMTGRTDNKLTLSLDEVIDYAQQYSTDAIIAKHQFLASYWQYRSFKAQLLPSLNMGLNLPNFSHTISAVQNSVTGNYNYVQNFVMRNDINLSIDQNLPFSGGRLSIYSALERMDQFSPNKYASYNSTPVSMTYTQPIFGSFNSLKWDKKIEPERYNMAKYTFLESMESIALRSVSYFFTLATAQQRLRIVQTNYKNTEAMMEVAKERFRIGSISKNELQQLELRLLNDGMAVNQANINLNMAKFNLKSYLSLNETVDVELSIPDDIPDIDIKFDRVYELATTNTSFESDIKIMEMQAESDVVQAKAGRGIKADLFVRFGLSQTGDKFADSYARPKDQEAVRLGLQMPILDWGMGRGRVQMAKSRQDVSNAQIDQLRIEHQQNVLLNVLNFSNQNKQCAISSKADTVARERYQTTMELFARGTTSVLELNTAQTEKDEAVVRYISELQNYWTYYYTLQKITLFDFRQNKNISTDFDKLVSE